MYHTTVAVLSCSHRVFRGVHTALSGDLCFCSGCDVVHRMFLYTRDCGLDRLFGSIHIPYCELRDIIPIRGIRLNIMLSGTMRMESGQGGSPWGGLSRRQNTVRYDS